MFILRTGVGILRVRFSRLKALSRDALRPCRELSVTGRGEKCGRYPGKYIYVVGLSAIEEMCGRRVQISRKV